VKLYVPVRTYNLTNARTHWRVRSKRVREQREAVTYVLLGADWSALPKPTPETPWAVRLVRLGPREMDDDGVVSAMKATRDAVAAFIGVDDRDRKRVRYWYDQEKSKDVGVRIEIAANTPEAYGFIQWKKRDGGDDGQA
jgi:hypothetical protein